MIVSELIAELKKFDQSLEVFAENSAVDGGSESDLVRGCWLGFLEKKGEHCVWACYRSDRRRQSGDSFKGIILRVGPGRQPSRAR